MVVIHLQYETSQISWKQRVVLVLLVYVYDCKHTKRIPQIYTLQLHTSKQTGTIYTHTYELADSTELYNKH